MYGALFWACVLFVFYVYLGYPILITILAAIRKAPAYDANFEPTVTLLIAAYNEEKIIAEKLENSLSLDYPRNRLQILVADDGSDDGTRDIIRSYADRGVELVSFSRRRGKLSALNNAMQRVRNEIVLLSDADNYYRPDTLREIVKPFSDPSVGAVSGGRVVIGKSSLGEAEGMYWKYEEFIKRQEAKVGSCVGVAGDALAVRRELYTFPPQNIINDDFYIALSVLKQGYRVVYSPKARSFHPISETEHGEVERRTRIVAGRYQSIFLAKDVLPYKRLFVVWQIISHKYFRPLVPFAMIGAFVANLLVLITPSEPDFPVWLMLEQPYDWIFFCAQMIFYSIAFIGIRYRIKGLPGKILYIPTFLVNSNLAAVRGLYRYLTNRQSVTWNRVSHSGRSND
jgi:cellulose synthase/poly-beta-1,6-N-acetylglucosamine synthase-like glycosyltransferase